jgi:NTE family protein
VDDYRGATSGKRDVNDLPPSKPHAALVFAGGMGLGAYQAGAYQKFHEAGEFEVDRLAGSSIGAINAALIAGNPPERAIASLREFWSEPNAWQPRQTMPSASLHYAQNWMSAIATRLVGAPGLFRPRTPGWPFEDFKSLYDVSPTRRSLERLIDFKRLNGGPRLTIATTDVATGEVVFFETIRDELTVDHLLASCGMMPEFPAVRIGDRLLGDGGLSANAPFDPLLSDDTARLIFVLDLFAREGGVPRSFTAAIARKNELMFGNQSLRLLEFWRDTRQQTDVAKRVVYMSYRASPDEADAERLFDFSGSTMQERWKVGALDMDAALKRARTPDAGCLTIVRR